MDRLAEIRERLEFWRSIGTDDGEYLLCELDAALKVMDRVRAVRSAPFADLVAEAIDAIDEFDARKFAEAERAAKGG